MMKGREENMGRKKISDIKVSNMKKLSDLGLSASKIARIVGVNRVTVCDYTIPGYYEKRKKNLTAYRRETVLGTGDYRNVTTIYGLSKRPHPGRCEVCEGFQDKKLNYHHWDDEHPGLGIWLCFWCHAVAELIDRNVNVNELAERYSAIRAQVEKNSGVQSSLLV